MRRNPPPLLSHDLRLHRAHEPLLVLRGGDGGGEGKSTLQRDRHRPPPARHLRLQLFLPSRIPGRPRRITPPSLPRGVRVVEVFQGVGVESKIYAAILESAPLLLPCAHLWTPWLTLRFLPTGR